MIKIRDIQARDRGKIYELMQQDDKFKSAELEAMLYRIDLYLFDAEQRLFKVIIAENENKELIGFAIYGPDPRAYDTYQIHNLAHSPKLKDSGVLNNLLQYIESQLLKNRGRIIAVEISSNVRYKNQYETYLKNNFNLSSRINNFYSRGEDKLILSKFLAL